MSDFQNVKKIYNDSDKEKERELIIKQTDQFIANGGIVQEIESGLTSADCKSLDTTLNPKASKSQRGEK